MPRRFWRLFLHAGWLAGAGFALALLSLGGLPLEGVPGRAPLGFPGADGVAGAARWNLAVFILPGLLLFLFAFGLEQVLQQKTRSRGLRIATGLLMISALAFAAQGLLPLDLNDLDGGDSQKHVASLALALLGWLAGASALSAALVRIPGWSLLVRLGGVLMLLGMGALIWPPETWMPLLKNRPGDAQRGLLAVYFAWFLLASLQSLRRRPTTP